MEDEGVELLKCEPNYLMHFHDGLHVTLSTDTATMKAEVERHEGPAGFDRYLSFLQEAHRHYTLSVQHVLTRPFSSFLSYFRPAFAIQVFTLHPFSILYSRAALYFRTERLRRAFTFGSMYMGMSPFESPATYSLLQYAELAEGIWYPRGGFHKVIEALVGVAERLGVKFHLSTAVGSVNVDPKSKRATGVTLSNGQVHEADVVLINADLVTAYSKLLPQSEPAIRSYASRLRRWRTSCSSISFYWSLSSSTAFALTTHNIFLAEHYKYSFDQIFHDHLLPDDPSFYVNCPGHTDPSAAPPGKDTVVVLVPCGHLDPDATPESEEKKWSALAERAKMQILRTIRARTGLDLAPLIVHEEINTPVTWATSLELDRGAILGLAHDFFSVLAFRPRTRARGLKGGCWFVGASTHPGTGVPIVVAGSKLVVDEILAEERGGWLASWLESGKEEWQRLVGWEREGVSTVGRRSLDRLGSLRRGWVEWLALLFAGLVLAFLTLTSRSMKF
jgi:phytoene desaturase (3,4-didehydrolycopene-forming)